MLIHIVNIYCEKWLIRARLAFLWSKVVHNRAFDTRYCTQPQSSINLVKKLILRHFILENGTINVRRLSILNANAERVRRESIVRYLFIH